MKNYQKLITAICVSILFARCNSINGKTELENYSITDSISKREIPTSASIEKGTDSVRKFIRTADLKFKVKSVITATSNIEKLVKQFDGFVTYTNLTSEIDNVTTIPISSDSSVETTYYTVKNAITLRVPNSKLDTALQEICANIDYLDYRIIKAEDVALQILSNTLTQNRLKSSIKRNRQSSVNRKINLSDITFAEEAITYRQEASDNAKISNLSLIDQVQFSTINLAIYQRQALKREVISNNKNISEYEPGFGSKLWGSVKSGWESFEAFVLFLTKFWALFILFLCGYLGYRKFVKHNSK